MRSMVFALALVASASAHAEVTIPDVPANRGGSNEAFEKAKLSMADAEKAFADGELTTALTHAEAGYRLYPNDSSARVVAFVFAKMERFDDAFRWYLLVMNLEPATLMKEEALEGLAALGTKMTPPRGWLTLSGRPEGARVTIDGVQVPNGVSVVGLAAGSHTVEVQAEGFEPFSRTLETTAGVGQSLEIELQAATLQPSDPPIAGYALLGTGAALTVAGGVPPGWPLARRASRRT